jgi:hypothetical protein
MADKRQTQPLVREGGRTGQDRSCQTVNKYLVMSPSVQTSQREKYHQTTQTEETI